MKIERFEDIEAWKAARELTRAIYAATAQTPFAKDFGLKDQIQRASVSIMANIAEGFDSQTNQEFLKFLGYALRSATEVESHLYVAFDQRYVNEGTFTEIYREAEKVKNLIRGFMRYLRTGSS